MTGTLLLIGGGALAESLAKQLAAEGIECARAPKDRAVAVAQVATPDLVVVAGDAAHDRGAAVAGQLTQTKGFDVPIVVVCAAQLGVLNPPPMSRQVAVLVPEGGMVQTARRVREVLERVASDSQASSQLQQVVDAVQAPAANSGVATSLDAPKKPTLGRFPKLGGTAQNTNAVKPGADPASGPVATLQVPVTKPQPTAAAEALKASPAVLPSKRPIDVTAAKPLAAAFAPKTNVAVAAAVVAQPQASAVAVAKSNLDVSPAAKVEPVVAVAKPAEVKPAEVKPAVKAVAAVAAKSAHKAPDAAVKPAAKPVVAKPSVELKRLPAIEKAPVTAAKPSGESAVAMKAAAAPASAATAKPVEEPKPAVKVEMPAATAKPVEEPKPAVKVEPAEARAAVAKALAEWAAAKSSIEPKQPEQPAPASKPEPAKPEPAKPVAAKDDIDVDAALEALTAPEKPAAPAISPYAALFGESVAPPQPLAAEPERLEIAATPPSAPEPRPSKAGPPPLKKSLSPVVEQAAPALEIAISVAPPPTAASEPPLEVEISLESRRPAAPAEPPRAVVEAPRAQVPVVKPFQAPVMTSVQAPVATSMKPRKTGGWPATPAARVESPVGAVPSQKPRQPTGQHAQIQVSAAPQRRPIDPLAPVVSNIQTYAEVPITPRKSGVRRPLMAAAGVLALAACAGLSFYAMRGPDAKATNTVAAADTLQLALGPSDTPNAPSAVPPVMQSVTSAKPTAAKPRTAPAREARAVEPEADPVDAQRVQTQSALAQADELVNEGVQLTKADRLGLAEAAYLKALKVVPNYPRAMTSLVQVHIQRGDGVEAVRWANQMVSIQPGRAQPLILLGDAQMARGDKEAARTAWAQAARLGSAPARNRLAKLEE